MDEDTRDLIVGLCTGIGMIMEDTSVAALTLRARDRSTWQRTLDEIGAAVVLSDRLATAARALDAWAMMERQTRPGEAVADDLYDCDPPRPPGFT